MVILLSRAHRPGCCRRVSTYRCAQISGATSEQLDILMKFITEAIESRNLSFGGGENGFVTRTGRGSTTEEDRQAVSSWLLSCTSVEQVGVKENEDAWYGWGTSDA